MILFSCLIHQDLLQCLLDGEADPKLFEKVRRREKLSEEEKSEVQKCLDRRRYKENLHYWWREAQEA